MGIYISNLEMPTNGDCISLKIYPDGGVFVQNTNYGGWKAISVPDHGDLKDAAYIEAENDRRFDFARATEEIAEHEYAYAYHVVASILATAPTIIPADKERE